jgi:hypothetical protein
MIPNWVVDTSFWLVVGLICVIGFVSLFLAGFALNVAVLWLGDRKKQRRKVTDPARVTVPAEVYRIVELREFIDTLWFKIHGRAIDDFRLLRIDRALGRATVGEYRIQVMREIGRTTMRDPDMFLTLARAAAIQAELLRSATLTPAGVIELEKLAGQRR